MLPETRKFCLEQAYLKGYTSLGCSYEIDEGAILQVLNDERCDYHGKDDYTPLTSLLE